VLWRMAIILKANSVYLFVSSVLFVFWYRSLNCLDTPRNIHNTFCIWTYHIIQLWCSTNHTLWNVLHVLTNGLDYGILSLSLSHTHAHMNTHARLLSKHLPSWTACSLFKISISHNQ
jgi:hypothetical protein